MQIVLGSKSPRRRELLALLGYHFIVYEPNVQETENGNTPKEVVMQIALDKAEKTRSAYPEDFIICADTIVVIDDVILGKPKDQKDAYRMIEILQGKKHFVYTGVVCWYQEQKVSFVEETAVYVLPMINDEIKNYVATIEPYDKAGGYAIQGIFAKHIERIEGDYYNVMGLPITRVGQIIREIKKSGE